MTDYKAIDPSRARLAQQQFDRAKQLEQIAKAEAAEWRAKYETGIHFASKEELAAALEQCPTYKKVWDDRNRFRRAFYVTFAFNVLAFIVSGLMAIGRAM